MPDSHQSAIAHRVWDEKYRLRDGEGRPLEADVAATWRRVASAVAAAEAPQHRAKWAGEFEAAMAGYRFLPGGRILAGAGAKRRVTLFNCFVMGTIPDSIEGIFENLKEAALTMQQGGGIGFDFSTLRPKGARALSVGADASGPLTFMDVWDAMCRTIQSAGARRGAMMGCMACSHPDIEDFIDAKREGERLRMFNLSVLASDAFMAAVKRGDKWDLVFDGHVYKTVDARALWGRIMRGAYDVAEPGVIFIDRINRENALSYCETISATNPCVTSDTWVQTADGPRLVRDLVGRKTLILVDGVEWPSASGFFSTGRKPVVKLRCCDGRDLRLTSDHPLPVITAATRWTRQTEWRAAGDLRPGDQIVLNDHRRRAFWGDVKHAEQDQHEGYLIGLLIGDGTIKSDKIVLSAWPGSKCVNGGWERPGVVGVMDRALRAANSLPHRADFAGWMEIAGRGEFRLSLGALRTLCERYGLAVGHKTITAEIERASSAFCTSFLQALFDADGSVQGTQEKGVSIRLAQSSLSLLQAAQRMLLRLGMNSVIHEMRRPAGLRLLPDGKGASALYQTQAQHELILSGENLQRFSAEIGFADTAKAGRLNALLAGYRRNLNREQFLSVVSSIQVDGEEEVYDIQVPGINAFDANGFLAHNCGEQPLPPYGACLLGSINLSALVKDPFTDQAALDEEELKRLSRTAVRFLDDVIDVSQFPLPAQAHEAKTKRRIGLGVTGLADALILMGHRYGGARAVELTERWLALIERAAYLASADLAAEKGAFPLFDSARYLAHPRIAALPGEVRAAISAKGLRNGLLTSIAPTGTISLFAGNVSSGIEPVFSYRYRRRFLNPDGSERFEDVEDHAYRLYKERFGDAPLPEAFVTAQSLTPEDHLRMQAAAQKHVDSAISKTINVARDIAFDSFKDIYTRAYELGCKGCTTYRPNVVTGAVLSTLPEEPPVPGEPSAEPREQAGIVYMTQPLERPETLPGETYKVRWPDSDHAIYITLNDIIQDGRRRPFEIFINSKNMEHYAWTVALTRMISAVFRRGGDVSFVVDELKAVFDPRGGHWMKGRYVPSLLAAIGEVIETHMRRIGFLAGEASLAPKAQAAVMGIEGAGHSTCPRCGQRQLTYQEGCATCLSCGYSKCS